MATKDRYPNFDVLRILLAAEVVVAHGWFYATPSHNWYAFVSAVPSFLAISGFLVLKSYAESNSAAVFWRKRALRILPALLVSFALYAILFDWHAVFNSILNWLSGGLYTLPGNANGPLWSLAWEELAYLCLTLLWAAGAYRRPVFIWLLFAGSVFAVWQTRQVDPQYQTIILLAPCFFLGNLMFLHRSLFLRLNGLLPWIVLVLVIWGRNLPVWGSLVQLSPPIFEAFAIVWVGMAGSQLLRARVPDISYGLYIYHSPILTYLLVKMGPMSPAEIAVWLTIPLLLVCLASWYLVEAPALKLKGRAGNRPSSAGAMQATS